MPQITCLSIQSVARPTSWLMSTPPFFKTGQRRKNAGNRWFVHLGFVLLLAFLVPRKKVSVKFVILIVLRYLCTEFPLAESPKGERVGFDFMEMGVYLAPVFDMS